jgi:hypothetical protein
MLKALNRGGGLPFEQTTEDPGGTTIVVWLGGGLSLLPKLMQPPSARVSNSGTNRARCMELSSVRGCSNASRPAWFPRRERAAAPLGYFHCGAAVAHS